MVNIKLYKVCANCNYASLKMDIDEFGITGDGIGGAQLRNVTISCEHECVCSIVEEYLKGEKNE